MNGNPTWKEDAEQRVAPGGLSKDPDVFLLAAWMLERLDALPTQNGLHGRAAAALVAALSVLFEEDFGDAQDWASMLAVMARVKNRPKSRDELRVLGGEVNGGQRTDN